MSKTDYSTYTPSKDERYWLDKAVSHYRTASDFWRPWIDWNRVLSRDYDMEMEFVREGTKILYPFRSQVFSPLVYQAVEILVPIIVSMILDHDPPFSAVAGRTGQDPAVVKKSEDLLAYQLRNRGFKIQMIHAIQQIVKIGSQIFRTRWAYESEYVTDRKTENYLGIPSKIKETRRQVLTYDGPDVVRIPFYRFFPDPFTPPCELQKAAYVCEEDVMSWERFIKDAGYFKYDNVDYVEYQVKNKQDSEKRTGSGRQQGEQDERAFAGDEYASDVRLIYHFDKQDVDTVALIPGSIDTGGILLKHWSFDEKCRNGKYPYHAAFNRVHLDSGRESGVDAEADCKPGGFYPPGSIQPIHGLQRAHNTTLNQRLDDATLKLRNPLLVKKGAILDINKLADGWIQNPIMEYDDATGSKAGDLFYQIKFADAFGSGWADQEQRIRDLVDDALGIQEAIKGEGDPTNRTARGYMQATANSMRRISLAVYIITKLGLEPMLTDMSDMNADLISPQTLYQVFGDPTPLYISPEEVVRGLAYTIRTVPPYSKQLMAQAAAEILPFLERYAPYAKTKRPIEIFLENQEWLENAEEIIPKNFPDLDFAQIAQFRQAMLSPAAPGLGVNPNVRSNQGGDLGFDTEAEARLPVPA